MNKKGIEALKFVDGLPVWVPVEDEAPYDETLCVAKDLKRTCYKCSSADSDKNSFYYAGNNGFICATCASGN